MVEFPTEPKQQLRAAMRRRRDALPATARAAWSLHLAEHGVDALGERVAALRQAAGEAIVAAYWPLRSEADPRPLARQLAARGAALALPVVAGETMEFRRWDADAELEPAGFGTFGPDPAAPVVAPAIVLVPLLAFDRRGHRLGWGKGYYDRFLAGPGADALAVGIAFACQEVEQMPSEVHDHALAGVLTERAWLAAGDGSPRCRG
jgi:5-formyltetrahydrofolate cyclo-ligase